MDLTALVNRSGSPAPWEEGDNIPWNEPGFSRRMLKEHLSQAHDAASRRFAIIDSQVDWIHSSLLSGRPSSILDLGCGPGFYSSRLAGLGHTCYGIDFSPASIEYAAAAAANQQLACVYDCQDIRLAQFPNDVDLGMLIYGEFNVFRPADAQAILAKSWGALKKGGILLLEPHTYSMVKKLGTKSASWYSSEAGLFFGGPHLVLQESFWDAGTQTTSIRYYVVQAPTGQVTRFAQTFQAYQRSGYRSLLIANGFTNIEFRRGLSDKYPQVGLQAIIARK